MEYVVGRRDTPKHQIWFSKYSREKYNKALSILDAGEIAPEKDFRELYVKSKVKELSFIEGFVSLHNREEKVSYIEELLTQLHSSIISGEIKKTTPYKEALNKIQNKLVKFYNSYSGKPSDKVKFTIDKKDMDQFSSLLRVKSRGLAGFEGCEVECESEVKVKKVKSKTRVKVEVKEGEAVKGENSRFVRADKRNIVQEIKPDVFRLPGEMGKFLQDLQPYKCAIAISGDPHAGKTEFVTQLIDSFCSIKKKVGFYSLEQGGMESKDTEAAIDRNVSKNNQEYLFVTGIVDGLPGIKHECKDFDVIVIDSWQELKEPSTAFNSLRNEYPEKIWVIIFQQNSAGGTRGGNKSDYDANIQLKVHKVDPTFVNNYVEMKKNRGNRLNVQYNIKNKKVSEVSFSKEQEEDNE